ncbi:alpha/beta fold hydrolase [Pseudodesulfovibrio cashew]|uniref:Alpha/beta fold hydrolase n=1 Tax=Pseudodesulfovibrio cashew TaxID=2678688 RepID=A0A6I6JMD5_9BACT|nr:alpha/beta hydrolase [Pseudodesulfovibrio cashew]QGY41287.1 alpha/beta fold hydrolase [Pseudodesulfovibrio cashew]
MDQFEAVETRGDNHVGGWVTTTDAARVWVDVHGCGKPMVLIHGWTMSSAFWKRQEALAEQCQVVTIDLRGHGKSDSVLRGHSVPRYARDVREVLRALGLSKVMLVGWSMGGSVVMEYWREFGGDLLSGLGLVETGPAPMSGAPWNVHRYRGGDVAAMKADLQTMVRDRRAFGERFVDAMFLSGEAPAHARRWMLVEHLKVNDHTATTIYEDYVQRDYTGVLPTITAPVFVAYGRSRHMCFGPSTGRYVAGSVPNSRFTILENSGHLPFYEEPAAFNNALGHFLNLLP